MANSELKPKYLDLFKAAFAAWREDQTPVLGAALAYYTVFSLAPLLIIAIAVAGMVFGEEAARGQIAHQISQMIGPDAAKGVEGMIQGAANKSSGVLATVIGIATLVLGASGVFGQLQAAMNQIWDVEPKAKGGFLKLIKDRFLSLTMVMGTCFLLLVSLLISAGLSSMTTLIGGEAESWSGLLLVADLLVSIGVVTVLFTALFKLLPDTPISWRDCWFGGFVTALLFALGKILIGLYIGRSGMASSYGAAGSLLVILLWVYYSSQILFFGAELTKAFSEKFGSRATAS
ncbi:MAG: YihY/virulence factor BrkB family protein [Chlorobia bacterium]|nr:YihY/virulence factor BrkB family protein [Fimbriimonadaceae bacterium]